MIEEISKSEKDESIQETKERETKVEVIMKSKKEIEEKIGFKLEYRKYKTYIEGNDYNNFQLEAIEHITLEQKSADAVKKLLIESLENGDIETSSACEIILDEAEIGDRELNSDFKLKRNELQAQFIEKYTTELQSIDSENMDTRKVEEILGNYQIISRFKSISNFADKQQKLAEVIQSKVEDKIQMLDEQIAELQEHIEIPENEEKINELQQEIESIEEKYVDFKAKIEADKEMENWKGKPITAFSHPNSEETIKKDLLENVFNHKAKRIEEQGIDTSEIMQDISQYKATNLNGRSSSDNYVIKFDELNRKVAKKTEYLERKLAILKENKEIPGNEKRILQVETELETMQDSWIAAQKGYNNIDGTNITEPAFMGKHHRDRLQREEQERVENSRENIHKLDEQIEELQKHIEIPENEQKIIELQAQIDEIEATIPSDRGNHKSVRLQKQGRDTEEIMADIEGIIDKYDDPYIGRNAKSIYTEIKTRVEYLENKKNYLQKHLDIKGNETRIAELQSQIEQLEDRWELCAQGFGSKEQVEARMRITKAHLYTTLMSFRTNQNLDLTVEQMQEYWDKIQNGEEVPELFGQHHKERIEREQEAKIREEQQKRDKLEQEYGLMGIKDKESLQRRLEDIVSKGIFLGSDKGSEQKVAEFEKMKQVIPRFEEFKDVYLQVRGAGIEDRLYTNIDFQNVSFDDLLEKATIILEEKAKEDKKRIDAKSKQVIIEEQPKVIARPKRVEKKIKEDEPRILAEKIEPKIEKNIEIDSASILEEHSEDIQKHQKQQTSQIAKNYWDEIYSQQAKTHEQQQPERIRPREESIRDEVGNELKEMEQQSQKTNNSKIDFWMNRFNGWYSAMDRVKQAAKAKFVKMKSDIIKAISEKIKERSNKYEFNKKQDSSER